VPIVPDSEQLDTNVPISEAYEEPELAKASAYFEDYLHKLRQDLLAINAQSGPSYGVIVVDGQPTLTAQLPSETLELLAGIGIVLVTLEGAPDSVQISTGEAIVTVVAVAHAAGDETIILVDDDLAGGDVTVTLPAAATRDPPYTIKKLGTTGNVIIDGAGAELIDDTLTQTISIQYTALKLVSDGSNWWII